MTIVSDTKRDVVQIRNPRTGRYVKIDRSEGKILSHKMTVGPYKNIPVVRKKASPLRKQSR